jgi:cytochrome bd-type quinol oxidase subunit 2
MDVLTLSRPQFAGAMAGRLWPVLLVVAAMFLLGSRTNTPLFNNYVARPVLLLIPSLAVALTFLPLVIAYQIWVHVLFKDKVSEQDVTYDEGY